MAELIKVNKKVINDPLFTPVIKFLEERIANLEITGPEDELLLSKERYDGLVAGDLVIESAIRFPDNVVRVCIISRKTGFARVDLDIKYAKMKDILEDFSVPMVEIEDTDHLKTYVKNNSDIKPTLLYLKYQDTYGVLITQEQAKTHEGPMTAFGDLFFENYTTARESLNSIDWETLESGTVTITDPSFGQGVYPLFIYELVLSEAQLPEITSNLPTSITSRRGESFVIPNTFWFGGTQDITTTATVELSTQFGYAILERSSDLLDIDGNTIYGSSTEDVADTIIVRVTYDWNGRLVRKNFRIAMTIEKDLENDLVITSVPAEVTATGGDVVEVTLTATYKGEKVEILIPPSVLKSQKALGNLTYVKTNPDLTMVYRGQVNINFPVGTDQVTDLWSAEFSFNDAGTVIKTFGYINSTLVRPDVLPKFTVSNVKTLIEGYRGDTGIYSPIIKYGDTVIPVNEVNLSVGPQGTKQLVDITDVTATSVGWELINDSGNPGQPVSDTFTQTYSWLDPRGVLQSQSFTITVYVKLNSIINVIQGPAMTVRRYQAGGVTWSLEVNGVVRNNLIRSLSLDEPLSVDDVDYIINRPKISNQWFVINADPNGELTFTGNFTFTAFVDGETQTFHVDQDFIVEKLVEGTEDGDNTDPPPVDDTDPNNPGGGPAPGEDGTGTGGDTGPNDPTSPGGSGNPDSPGEGDGPYNTEITAVPTSFTIAGDSDKSYQITFKVYKGTDDVTAESEIMSDKTVVPDFVTFDKMSYDETDNVFVVEYSKDKGGVSQGAIFAKLKDNATPTKKQIARLWVNVNIVQTKILKFIDPPTGADLDVTVSKDIPVNIEFSGTKLNLNDPNLTIVKLSGNNTNIEVINADSLTVLNNVWSYIGRTVNDPTKYQFTYQDPEDGKLYIQTLSLDFAVTYPPMELIYTEPQELDVNIWDTGEFPIKLQAGAQDFTDNIRDTVIVSGNNYVKLNYLSWEVYFAESTTISQIVGLNISWAVGSSAGSLPADFKFNIAAWDGIVFAPSEYSPESINGTSGDTGEITASFVYKGKDGTEFTQFVPDSSVIPETVELGTVSYDPEKGLVIPYTLKRGGENILTLVFSAPGTPGTTTTINIDTIVSWPQDLNIEDSGSDIRGYWNTDYTYPLVLNFAGTPVPLNDTNLELTFNSGEGDPIQLTDTLEESLILLLAAGGDLGVSYDYIATISLVYTDPADNATYAKELSIPASIRVPDVRVGNNPTIAANVFDHGVIPITLVDETNNLVPIKSYNVNGAGSNVMFLEPNGWYVTNGLTTGSTEGTLPLQLSFDMGGSSRTIDVIEKFAINKWDGNSFKVIPSFSSIDGAGGDTGTIPFDITYQGFPRSGSTVDLNRSVIPSNINIGQFDGDDNLPYTLAGNDDTDMTICVVRSGAVEPMKEGTDYVLVDFSVKTVSTNLPFTLVSSDDEIALNWGDIGTINFVTKYGDKEVPSNAPGLVVKLADAEIHGIEIVSQTNEGIIVKATRSNVPGATKVYPEMFNITYQVGAPELKTAVFTTNVSISMGPVTITNNDEIQAAIWTTGSFQQKVQFNGIVLDTVDHFELQQLDNKYVEVIQPRGYEVVGAEPTLSTQAIPMVIFFKVDETNVLQQLNFDAEFKIPGSTSVRFKVNTTPTTIEGSVNNETVVTCTPVYKDQLVGGQAAFKPALSTIPEQLTLKEYKVVGTAYVLTFVGAKAGLGELDLVFWSPGAGTSPKPSDTYTVKLGVKIMGDLGLEMGTRDNLITGKNADTGTYRFQILFGGVPIDAAAEIANGNLVATREVGVSSSVNANIINIDSWGSAAFNYTLNGCVIPGAVANVSDFINLTYKYGGNNYTSRIEIPLKYTSSAPVFGGWPTGYLKVFSKGSLSPTAVCDGVTITSGINSIGNYGAGDDYVTLGGIAKSYEIINGDIADSTHTVHARIIGQYRTWAWAVETDIPFNIAAWNQRTWDPSLTGSPWSVYMDLTGRVMNQVNLTGILKNAPYAGFTTSTGDLLLADKSDLLGLVDLSYYQRASNTIQYYQMFAKKIGSGTLKLCFKNPESSITPGVEGVDFSTIDYNVEVKENSLYGEVGTGAAKGGSGDTVTGSLIVKLMSTGAAVSNINTNLVIAPVDETVFRITGKTANTITVLVTAPYTVPDGVVNVPMTFTYTDPTTGFVTKGTFDYPFTIQRPSDWPIATQTVPTNTIIKLWDYGPNPFSIKSGTTDITASAVPTQVIDDQTGADGGSNYMQLSLNQPVAGTWWWETKAVASTNQQTRNTKWKINVPYRGDTINIDAVFSYVRAGDGTTPIPEFQGSTTATKTLMQDIGDQAVIPFKLLWRNYKYGNGVFRADLSGLGTTKFSDYFKVISQTYDSSDGTTYLTIEMTAVYQGSMAFVWDKADASANPVVGIDRASVSTSFYDLDVVDLGLSSWKMWDRRQLSALISIKDNGTELISNCKVISVSNPILVPVVESTVTYIRAMSDIATAAFTGNVVYRIQLPVAYNNRIINVTIPSTITAYDGNELVVSVQRYTNPILPTGSVNEFCYFNMFYRGSNVPVGNRISTVNLLNSVNENDNSLLFGNIGADLQTGEIGYSFGSSRQRLGKVKLPVRYAGTMETPYPTDTLGKNLAIMEIDCRIFEPRLYIYPDDKTPDQVEGTYTKTTAVPVQFSVGLNFPDNLRNANTAGMTWSIIGTGMTGVVSKPSTNFSSATGINLQIDYDNRDGDFVVDVPIRMNYTGVVAGVSNVNSNKDWIQKVLIKGSNTGNTVVVTPGTFNNTVVWSVYGPALTIVHNGTTITAANIKDIQIASNPYIRRPETTPNTSNRWFEIYNGRTDGPTNTVGTFTVTYTDGARDYTITQDVAINIRQYSGSPWSVTPVWTQATTDFYALGPAAIVNGNVTQYLTVRYKNVTITESTAPTYGISVANVPADLPGFIRIQNQGYFYSSIGSVFQFVAIAGSTDTLVKKKGKIKFGFKDKIDDPTSIEGQDWVYVDLETVVWSDVNQYYLVTQGVTDYTGKFGDPNAKFPFTIRRQNVMTSLVAQNNPVLTNNGNLQAVYNQSDNATAVTAFFNKELTTGPSQTLDTVMWLGRGSSSYSAKAIVRVTQLSNYTFPTVSNVNKITTSINQSGTLPFKLTSDTGTDITSQATITAISTNDYIRLDSGKWYCYNARTADTEIQVTFTYQITYKGNLLTMTQDVPYLITGFSGQPTVSNVQVISGNVWDKGTILPFTINVNGSAVPDSWITTVTGTSANGRVTVTSKAQPWQIVAGDLTKAVSDTVSYTVTVTNGTSTWTVRQDVVFNIAQYDGIEFRIRITNLNSDGTFLATNGQNVIVNLERWYRGDILPGSTNFSSIATVSLVNATGSTFLSSEAATTRNYGFATNSNVAAVQGKNVFRFRLTGTGNTGTPGVNYVDVVIPITTYFANTAIVGQDPTTIEGKKGNEFIVKALWYFNANRYPISNSGFNINIPASLGIEMIPGSIVGDTYKVRFINTLDADKTTSDNITYSYSVGGTLRSATAATTVIQHAGSTQPDVNATGTMTPIKFGETGSVVLTGTVGINALAGNVTFVPGSSDGKGLVTFGDPVNNGDGTVSIPVTGIKVGTDNLIIHITVNGATGTVSGKDYLDVSVPAQINYADLAESEDFQTTGTGYSTDNLTLVQSVTLPAE